MQKEFLGIGRTWFGVYAMLALTGAMVFTGHIEVDMFLKQAVFFLGIGGGKSGLEKVSNAFKKG